MRAALQDRLRALADTPRFSVELLVAADSSSLNIMFDLISWSYIFGTNDSPRPWSEEETVKWICPVPGYDRHFAITELFGCEMLTVPMTSTGPDMDAVRELAKDPAVKGMLPSTKLGRAMASKLKVYAGPNHPHAAQRPVPFEIKQVAQ